MQWQKGVSYVLLAEQLSLILFSLMTKVPQISHLPLAGQDLHILPTSLNSTIITSICTLPKFLPFFVVENPILHFTNLLEIHLRALPIHPHPPEVLTDIPYYRPT